MSPFQVEPGYFLSVLKLTEHASRVRSQSKLMWERGAYEMHCHGALLLVEAPLGPIMGVAIAEASASAEHRKEAQATC